MQKFKLQNGLTVVFDQKPLQSVTVQATVKVGSINETLDISGISHFIEHMLFEGTKKRPTSKIIASEIENVGGEINAYTSNERTCFYAKVPKKHFISALDIISDIIQNPLFNPVKISKERKIILKEINLHKDEPRFHQWVMFQKALFKDHPAKNVTYGTVKAVSSLSRKEILNFYSKFYVPNNIILTIVGDLDNVKSLVEKAFNFKRKKLILEDIKEETTQIKTVKKEIKKILNSYMILGYKTPKRSNNESYIFDVIRAILGKGQSGRLFEEIRNKRGLAYEVGAYHEPACCYGYFAVYLNTAKSKIPLCTKLILNEFNKLKNLSKEELDDAKSFLEGKHLLDNEDSHDLADELGFWESVGDAKLANNYIKEIMKVTKKDINKVVDKYFTENYTLTVIQQA